MSNSFPADPRAPKIAPPPATPGSQLKEAGKNVGEAVKLQGKSLQEGWNGFKTRFSTEGPLKAISGMSTGGKLALGTLAVGAVATVVVSRNRHKQRVLEQQQSLQQGQSL